MLLASCPRDDVKSPGSENRYALLCGLTAYALSGAPSFHHFEWWDAGEERSSTTNTHLAVIRHLPKNSGWSQHSILLGLPVCCLLLRNNCQHLHYRCLSNWYLEGECTNLADFFWNASFLTCEAGKTFLFLTRDLIPARKPRDRYSERSTTWLFKEFLNLAKRVINAW